MIDTTEADVQEAERSGVRFRLTEPDSSQARERSAVRDAMVRFTVLSGVCLVIVGLLSVLVAGAIAESLAANEAEARTQSFAAQFASPHLDADVRRSIEGSELEEALDFRIADRSIYHGALYAEDGTVIWSAEPESVGDKEELSDEVLALFGTTGSISHYSQDHTHAAGQEGPEIALLEVYAGGIDSEGNPFVLEWYWPTNQLANDEGTILRRLLPVTVGALLIFQLLVLPLTLATARRVEQDRTRLTQHVVNASRLERRRVSEDLHDGVAQDLAAIGYVLPMIEKDLPEGSPGRGMLGNIREMLQSNISLVRGLIADIRPLDLRGDGFREALDALALRMQERGIQTNVTVTGNVDALSVSTRALAFRVVREGLRNVVRHSGATQAWIDIEQQWPHISVVVRDNGRGLSGSTGPTPSPEDKDPHFGLDLLREALSDVEGTLELSSDPEGGAQLCAHFRTDRVLA